MYISDQSQRHQSQFDAVTLVVDSWTVGIQDSLAWMESKEQVTS